MRGVWMHFCESHASVVQSLLSSQLSQEPPFWPQAFAVDPSTHALPS